MKKKTRRGWKVILDGNRQSASNSRGLNRYSVMYPVNKEVFPKLKNSKLFFFNTKENAQSFADQLSEWTISTLVVPCIATNPTQRLKYLCKDVGQIASFWINHNSISVWMRITCPEGTWFADSITCLE